MFCIYFQYHLVPGENERGGKPFTESRYVSGKLTRKQTSKLKKEFLWKDLQSNNMQFDAFGKL